MSKKYRQKHKYTKSEFVNICCNKCRICKLGASPDLCYSEFYRKDPKRFIKKVFKSLLGTRHLLGNANYSQSPGWVQEIQRNAQIEQMFKIAFCANNLCGRYILPIPASLRHSRCANLDACLNAFKRQINGEHITIPYEIFSKAEKQRRYVVQAYPSFFTNDSDTFRAEIKKILNEN